MQEAWRQFGASVRHRSQKARNGSETINAMTATAPSVLVVAAGYGAASRTPHAIAQVVGITAETICVAELTADDLRSEQPSTQL